MTFQPDQSAAVAHTRMKAAVKALDDAEQCAVLWFADIDRRRLYRELGHASMWQYAVEALGFSRTRAKNFLTLARRLDELPAVKASVASGELGYTKAREIVRVAGPETEQEWLEEAAKLGRRELERKVKRVRKQAKARPAAQVELLPPPADEPRLAEAVPVRVGVSMTAEQAARYEALWSRLGKTPNAEDLLAALETLVGTGEQSVEAGEKRVPRGPQPPVQIHVHQCPDCGAAEVAGRPLDRADVERIACDAAIAIPGERNATTIPPRVRREVLARDRHRCRAPGCEHTRFLEVHHIIPRSRGGSNAPENLITLCSACHRLMHEGRRTGSTDLLVGTPRDSRQCQRTDALE